MKPSILLLALTAAAFSSCTTAYKTGQTPDDVYYSPTRPQEEYVRIEKLEDRYYRGSDDYYEDRFLRMRLQDRYRWSALDDYYFYNTYAYNAYGSYNNGWYSPWNSYWTWNSYYNPYCGGIPYYYYGGGVIKTPRTYSPPSRPIAFNPNSYNSGNNNNRPLGSRSLSNSYNNSNSRYNNSNSNRSSLGESVRKVFSNSNSNSNYSNSNNNNSTPSRSYNPSSNSNSSSSPSRSSSSGGSSSGSGSSRPPR